VICVLNMDEGCRRGHDQKVFKKRYRFNLRKFAFSNRVVDNLNSQSLSMLCKYR